MITAVKKVLEAEKKAEDRIAQAHKTKEKILAQARHDALGMISEGQKRIDEEQEAFLKQRQAEIEEKKQKLLEENERRVHEIERSAATAVPKAEAVLLEKCEELLKQ